MNSPAHRGRRLTRPSACWLLLGLLITPTVAPARERAVTPDGPTLTAEERAKNVESFEVVWTTIRDKHFDPKLNGLDWQAVRDELMPKVAAAESRAEARAVMADALGRLRQTHFGIIPADAYKAIDDARPTGDGEPGVEVRILDGRPVVSAVIDGSPADEAGVRPGWIVAKVRDKAAEDVLATVARAYRDAGMVVARQALAIDSLLGGPVGGTVAVEFLDGDDCPVRLDLKLREPQGNVARFGNLPPFHVRFRSKRVAETVGYVSLNVFFDPPRVMPAFAEAVAAHRDAEGLVIDLRGNPGGVGAMALGLGGWFIAESDKKLGTMITRDGSLNFALNPRAEPYEGPVAILVDELSMSTSEIFAGGLQDLKRARVFGTKTPGAALPSRIDRLPNGDRFQYAFANYISAGGKPLEGLGVTPDESVPPTRADLLAGRDPALAAAIAWIRSRPATP